MSSPSLPQRRKVPKRYEFGESAPVNPETIKDNYRRIYFEAIDLIASAIGNRFNQKGFNMLQKLETILTTAQQSQIMDTLTEVVEFYSADFN